MSKKKWAEIRLNWQRYGGEYLSILFIVFCFLTCIWVFAIRPANKAFEDDKRSALKTEIIRNIDGNISRIPAKNENQAEEIKNRLEAIKKDDNIKTLESITINQNNDRFEVVVIIGRN